MNEYTARYIKNASQTKTEDVLALESAQITNYYDVGNGFYLKRKQGCGMMRLALVYC